MDGVCVCDWLGDCVWLTLELCDGVALDEEVAAAELDGEAVDVCD